MTSDDTLSRRRMIQYTGAAAATALVAGCGSSGGGDDGGGGDGGGGGGDGGSGNGGGETDVSAWEDVEEIELEGQTSGWVGVAPDPIADEENPTLVLFNGQEYTISFENTDGQEHNLQILNGDGDVVDDYETDSISSEGETATLEGVQASDEMTNYICEPHESTMDGQIQIEENGGGGGGGGSGNESEDGNESDGEMGNESASGTGNESDGGTDNESEDGMGNESDGNESE
ncbi:hypothetical protein HALLA_12725 [Halostagnicola larsenii XH-48]|uniref:Blue (type 1) copper domain-containing protein n=1 Tax=Halostagnicola larsenii XH-48 TaxID=797299 RepID=W0JLA7_9EURY|nr:plastocyanin/azurin family copper-binding protein [Halostagnicola larsenii]AHF99525.1 hypothetical protein HALLA_12725 [Halostagnicola larsenii XH-48]